MGTSVPIKLLHEAQGHVVSIELTNGLLYRGKMIESEDNMNVQLKDVIVTNKDGSTKSSAQVYIRGSQIQFISVPDILSHAPIFPK